MAVDWSGRRTGERQHIWLARAAAGELVELRGGFSRAEVVDHLVRRAEEAPQRLVVGLDFSFALPAWFTRRLRATSAQELWRIVAHEGEGWLADCRPPFWGRPGRPRPALPEHLRRTERQLQAVGATRVKSTFQIAGAGSVGTGSLRGMPWLLQLRRRGFRIWPFDEPGHATVVEIYPRLLTGPVVKARADQRQRHLARHHPVVPAALGALAAASDDAFDAAVSALVLAQHRTELAALQQASDSEVLLEGQIWQPVVPRRLLRAPRVADRRRDRHEAVAQLQRLCR